MRLDFRLMPFVVLCGVELLGEWCSFFPLIVVSKPLLMPALAFWWYGNKKEFGSEQVWVLLALLFSTLGDVLLLFSRQYTSFFLLGLGAFLVAHLFYILTFWKLKKGDGYLIAFPLLTVPFLLYLIGLLAYLWSGIPAPMRWAVVLYGAVIMVMALSALHLRRKVPENAFWTVFFGAVLFVLSDTMIAINKFRQSIPSAGLLIMSTYVLGQYGIVRGLLGISAARAASQQSQE